MKYRLISGIFRLACYLLVVTLHISFISSNSFLHVHVTPEGKFVVHSHPFKADNPGSQNDQKGNTHHHSNAEYYYYHSVSHTDKFILVDTPRGLSVIVDHAFRSNPIPLVVSRSFSFDYSFRAPPS